MYLSYTIWAKYTNLKQFFLNSVVVRNNFKIVLPGFPSSPLNGWGACGNNLNGGAAIPGLAYISGGVPCMHEALTLKLYELSWRKKTIEILSTESNAEELKIRKSVHFV